MKIIVSANLSSNILSRKNLLLALQKNGYTVTAAGCVDHGVDKLAELGIDFVTLPMENKGTAFLADLGTFFAFLRLYRKLRPSAVLHFNSKPDIYGSMAANLLGIHSINNVTGLGTVYVGQGGIVRRIVNFLYRLAFSGKKSFVFFQNAEDRELFVQSRIVNADRTGILPGSGVDVTRFSPNQTETKNKDCSGRDEVRFLFASRLVIAKGVREFIGAASIVKRQYPYAVFEMIGELLDFRSFIPREELQLALDSGFVEYGGNLRDTESVIRRADCVVLPSFYREGVPRILLEGAAMGKPLIAADSTGTREPVTDGVNGYLCMPESIESLAEKMLAFLALTPDQRIGMGCESRIIAETKFTDTIVSRGYLDVLQGGKTQ